MEKKRALVAEAEETAVEAKKAKKTKTSASSSFHPIAFKDRRELEDMCVDDLRTITKARDACVACLCEYPSSSEGYQKVEEMINDCTIRTLSRYKLHPFLMWRTLETLLAYIEKHGRLRPNKHAAEFICLCDCVQRIVVYGGHSA